MFSEFAKVRINKLIKAGINLEPAEIIRLNDLALAVEKCDDVSDNITPPKVAWAGDTILHEPTIASTLWYDRYALKWWKKESAFYALLWSCAHARDVGFFEDKTNEKEVRKDIVDWYSKLNCTESEFIIALNYVINKSDDSFEEEDEENEEQEYINNCPYTKMVHDLLGACIGISEAEIKSRTYNESIDILTRWARAQIASNGGDTRSSCKSFKTRSLIKFEKYFTELERKYGYEQNKT